MVNKRNIVHMDMDTFFVSVERLCDNRLNGKPILIGGSGDRGVVASCSYETRSFGVHAAMPMRMARQLCPQAIQIRGYFGKYCQKSQEITENIKENVPLFEKSSIDEFYINYTGMDRFFGCFKMASELRQKILLETGLPVSLGLPKTKPSPRLQPARRSQTINVRFHMGKKNVFSHRFQYVKFP